MKIKKHRSKELYSFFITTSSNLLFRGLSIGSKFLLILAIGKYLSVDDLGIYGLFNSAIIMSTFILGLDFYLFNSREIIKNLNSNSLPLIRDQFIFHGIAYIITLPLLYIIISFGWIPHQFFLWFFIVLILEHVSQEFFRLFTTIFHPVYANFVYFLKNGFWILLLIPSWLLGYEKFLNLESVLLFWAVGGFLSVSFSLLYLHKLKLGKIKNIPVNWKWIKKGIIVSIPFFIGTISYKIIEFSDRFILDFFLTKNDVGIYTFFGSMSNLINAIVATAVVMIYYPKLYKYYSEKDIKNYIKTKKIYIFLILSISLLTGAILLGFIKPLLIFLKKQELNNNLSVFYILILANIMFNISLIPHYLLYVKKKDKEIMLSTLIPSLFNIGFNIMFIPLLKINGAGISKFFTFFFVFVLKYFYYRKYK